MLLLACPAPPTPPSDPKCEKAWKDAGKWVEIGTPSKRKQYSNFWDTNKYGNALLKIADLNLDADAVEAAGAEGLYVKVGLR